MENLLNLEKYPLDKPLSVEYQSLVLRCRKELANEGMFNLDEFVRSECLDSVVSELSPKMASESFLHERSHNIYFKKEIEGLRNDHPALLELQTVNRTLCADQLSKNPVVNIYEWRPLVDFLASVMGKPQLHTMKDALARVNVMAYREGETLNWHFDRSEFTTTLLLQAPESGGVFEYRTNLRSSKEPNYDGVEQLLLGLDPEKQSVSPAPGTLNVFRGINTPHRVTTIKGHKERIIAVYSYYDIPGVEFSSEEQMGFYGRTG